MKFRTAKNKNAIVIGMLLGDACIQKDGRMVIGHGEQQREYVEYKKQLLQNFFTVVNYEQTINLKNKQFKQIGIKCYANDYLKNMRKIFYKKNKEINMRQLKKLNPLGLALWYMDDGSLIFQRKNGVIESRKGYLNTQCFSREENEIMVQYFKEVYDINCKIHLDKGMCRLYFNSSELKKLIKIIEPYVIDSMKYKICMRYGKNKSKENLCKKECSECSSYCKLK